MSVTMWHPSQLFIELPELIFFPFRPLTEICIEPFFIHIHNSRLEVTLSILVGFWDEPTAFILSVEGSSAGLWSRAILYKVKYAIFCVAANQKAIIFKDTFFENSSLSIVQMSEVIGTQK